MGIMNLGRLRTSLISWSSLILLLILALPAGLAADSVCRYCGGQIGSSYVQYNGEFYHSSCYAEHVAPRCGICNEPLNGQWVVFDGQNYHQECYQSKVALRCSVCNGIITGQYLIDHWGNKYHAHHREEIRACSFCGRLLSDPKANGGQPFDADHHICGTCSQDAVTSETTANQLVSQSRTLLAKTGIVIEQDDIEFELISRAEFSKLAGRTNTDSFGLTHYEKTTTWTMLEDKTFTIYLLKGQPSRHFMSVAAHELMHVWLYLNAPDHGDPSLVEGSCNYAAYLVLNQLGDEIAGYVVQQLLEDPGPIYGDGFRRVKKLVDNRGVEYWLNHLKFDIRLPIGY